MIIIDAVVLLVLGLGVLVGWYHGTIRAAANMVSVLLAIMIGLVGQNALATRIIKQNTFVPQMIYYSESDSFLKDVDTVRLKIDELDPESIDQALENTHLPFPVEASLRKNIASRSFSEQGLTMLGEYLSMTIALLSVHILSFLFLFLISVILLFLINKLLDYVIHYPVLRYGDSILGGFLGLLCSAMLLFVVCTLIPVGLSYVPFDELRLLIVSSSSGRLFYESNFLLSLLPGIAG